MHWTVCIVFMLLVTLIISEVQIFVLVGKQKIDRSPFFCSFFCGFSVRCFCAIMGCVFGSFIIDEFITKKTQKLEEIREAAKKKVPLSGPATSGGTFFFCGFPNTTRKVGSSFLQGP